MNGETRLEDIQTLKDLDFSFSQFVHIVEKLLYDIDMEIKSTEELLNSRYEYWRSEIEHWKEVIENSEEDEDLGYAYQKLSEAKENLNQINFWMKEVNERRNAYYYHKRIISELMENKFPKASHFLKQKYEELLPYFANIESYASPKKISPTEQNNKEEFSQGALISGIPVSMCALPPGFKWVKIEEIDPTYLPKPDEDFKHHASYETIQNDYRRLILELLPLLQVDPQLTRDYLRKLDLKQSVSYPSSLESVYDMFFSKTDPIYLTKKKSDSLYSITSGAHRIKVAIDLGLSFVPAMTVEVN